MGLLPHTTFLTFTGLAPSIAVYFIGLYAEAPIETIPKIPKKSDHDPRSFSTKTNDIAVIAISAIPAQNNGLFTFFKMVKPPRFLELS
jgi:hypothetical protein